MSTTTSFFEGAHATPSYGQHMSSRISSLHLATRNFITPRPQQGFVPWSSPYQATVDPRGQYGSQIFVMLVASSRPYMNLPDTIVPLKKRHDRSKYMARNDRVPAFDLGNVVVDDNLGDDEVAITGAHETDECIWYTNVDPSTVIVRRETYEECLTFLNNPHPVYLDCHVKGYRAMEVFWRELVPSLYMSGYYKLDEPEKEGWLSDDATWC
ncbi:hypothetical protein Tco_1296611 [Tanacetum coccineum]